MTAFPGLERLMRRIRQRNLVRAAGTIAAAIAIGTGAPGMLEAKIVYPPDSGLLKGDGKIEVLAFRPAVAGPGKVVVVHQGASKEYAAGTGVVRVKVSLSPGSSTLQLDGESVTVFLAGAGAEKSPAGFEIPDAHVEGIDCGDCHRIGEAQAPLLDPGGKLCLRCHDDVTKPNEQTPVIHPPAQEGDCFACHKLHGAAIKQLSAEGRRALCLGCHSDVNLNPAGAMWATPHAPVAKGMCTSCHGPHGAPLKRLLLRRGNDVCQSCHKEPHTLHRSVKDPGHLAEKAVVPKDFPVSRTGELGCGGCHLPHGSDNKRLFIRDENVLCRACHKKL